MADLPTGSVPSSGMTQAATRATWLLAGIAVLLSLVLLLCAACGRAGGSREPAQESRTPSGIRLGGTFRMYEPEEVRSLDPVRAGSDEVSQHVAMNIYDGLVEYDPDLNLKPALAERWEVSPDGLEYTFHLRPGVRFQDDRAFPKGSGRVLTAEDVRYSLLRVADKRSNSTGWWAFQHLIQGLDDYREGFATDVSGIQIVDPATLRIRLTRPFSPFLHRLAMAYGFVVPREAVERYRESFFQHPVGTGPFRFVSWSPNQEVVLEKNPHYWDVDGDGTRLPYLDRLEVRLITDAKSGFLNFDTGKLEQLEPIPLEFRSKIFDEQGRLKGRYAQYQIARAVEISTDFYGFNLRSEPWKSHPELRQAVNYAIDREQIVRFVVRGGADPAHEVIPPSMPGFSRLDAYPHDVAKAKALVAEAGFPNGKGLPPITLELNSGGTINDLVAEAIQSQLAAIGLRVSLLRLAFPQHLENIENGRASFYRSGWVCDYPDPEAMLALFDSTALSPGGNNFFHYANPEFQRLFEAAVSETDRDRALELYRQAQQIVLDDAPLLLLYHRHRIHLLQPYVRGFEVQATNLRQAKYWWLDKAGR